MFQKLKKFFSKNKNINYKNTEQKCIYFKDLYNQNIEISTVIDGNKTAIMLKELTNDYKIVCDKEEALILSIILNQYYKNENLNDLANLFESEEK